MLASLPDPRRLLWRGTVGSVGAYPAVRIASGPGARGGRLSRKGPAATHSRRKYTGPQHASVGVLSAARTWSHRARSPTA